MALSAARALTPGRAHADSLGAVIVEPMLGGGCIPGTREFLAMLREKCTLHDIVLIFDEVMTSRLSPSGLQGLLGIKPDMTSRGKYLGGGASFGAFGGRRDIMERFDPSRPDSFDHAGTFNNIVLSMAGGLAGLTKVYTAAEAVRLNALGDRLRDRLNRLATMRGAPFHATGLGSLIGLHFGNAAESAQRTVESLFHLDLLDRGYYFSRRGYIALSLPTTDADCEDFAAAVDDFFAARGPLIGEALRFSKEQRE
jgi:glutamate-1-semialdehyde 2,1-aminomutase